MADKILAVGKGRILVLGFFEKYLHMSTTFIPEVMIDVKLVP